MNVLTIFTGGTIACSRAAGALAPDRGNSYLLLDAAKGQDVEFTTACPYMILSENLSFARLRQLFDCLTRSSRERVFLAFSAGGWYNTGKSRKRR